MTTSVTRRDLSQLVGITPKLLRFFEELFATATGAATDASGAAMATGSIQSATVLTLSSNAAFDNERVVIEGAGITITDDGSTATIAMTFPISLNGGFSCALNLAADTLVDLPATGRIPSSSDGPYADDATAAAAGVAVGEWYAKPGGIVTYRQA